MFLLIAVSAACARRDGAVQAERQLETAQAALQSKELTIAKMRSRIGSSNTTGALAQDMARLGYTLGLKST